MLKKIALSLALLSSVAAHAAPSKELSLVCINPANTEELEGYQVLVADEGEVVALRASSQSPQILRLSQYAVVMKGFLGDEGFEVRKASQFELVAQDRTNYTFNDKILKLELICSVNRTVHANPALTISN